MDKLMSGTLFKRLKWPSVKQWAFWSVCLFLTFVWALDRSIPPGESVVIFFLFAFFGFLIVGWFDKLWLVLLIGFIANLLALPIGAIFGVRLYIPVDLGGFFIIIWVLSILFLWYIPYEIKENANKMIEKGREHKIPRPRYKLSDLFRVIWAIFWGVVLFLEVLSLGTGLNEISQLFADGDFFSYRAIFVLYRLLYKGIWGPIAILFLIDLLRKDARFFYASVGLVAAFQVVNLWFELIYFDSTGGDIDKLFLILLLIGGSLLLRAAWKRPSPEAGLSS